MDSETLDINIHKPSNRICALVLERLVCETQTTLAAAIQEVFGVELETYLESASSA